MTTSTDPRAALQKAMADLTGPGGRFELVEEDVLGGRARVFAHRGRSLRDLLAESAEFGARDYIATEDGRLGFAEHAAQAAALARCLRDEHGVRRGDRVAIAAANTPRWVAAFWAAASLGAVTAAFNGWWTRSEMEYALGLTRPKAVFADAERARVLDGLHPSVIGLGGGFSAAVGRHAGAPMPEPGGHEDDPAVAVFTSGTTGRPKAAVHSQRNLLAVVEYHRLMAALTRAMGDVSPSEEQRFLLALPLFHIAGLHNVVVPRLAMGNTVVMHQGAFDPDRVLRLIEKRRVTSWGAVPTMAHRILEHGDLSRYDLSSVKTFALATAPSSPAFKDRVRKHLPFAAQTLAESYGLTESTTAITVASAMDLAEAPDTQGRPIAGVDVEIRGAAGEVVPDGTEGEICTRSQFTMLGYMDDEASTAAAFDGDRWLRTGDFGAMRDGYLRLSHRRSDLILRGGENVYPAEVEAVIAEHPEVLECAVLGRDDADLGQSVLAVVVPRAGSAPSAESLRAHTAAHLAYYKVPSTWIVRGEALPRNATGKVVRREVRRIAEEGARGPRPS